MTVVVMLTRSCLGQDVLDAFRAAASYQETQTQRWEAKGYLTKDSKLVEDNCLVQCGYRATPAYLKKQNGASRLLFGARSPKWKTYPGINAEFSTQIKLLPIWPDESYAEVRLEIYHEYARHHLTCVATTPNDAEFEPFKAGYDHIVKEFQKRLK